MVPNNPFKEGSIPNAQDVFAYQVGTLLSSKYFSHHTCAQASEDSAVLNLEDALSKAYEEIADLRRRVLELETQAAELFKSKSPPSTLTNVSVSQFVRGFYSETIMK